MPQPHALLDHTIATLQLKNDARLAKLLGLGAPAISKMRAGIAAISPATILTIHDATGIAIKALRFLAGDFRQHTARPDTPLASPEEIRQVLAAVGVAETPPPEVMELPEGLTTSFEVDAQVGLPGQKTWVLRDLQSGRRYRVTPKTAARWKMRTRRDGLTHSIILAMGPSGYIAMHLGSGEVYRTGAPPARLR